MAETSIYSLIAVNPTATTSRILGGTGFSDCMVIASDNGGADWGIKKDDFSDNWYVRCFGHDPSTETICAGLQGPSVGEVWKSTDWGDTWTEKQTNMNNGVYSMIFGQIGSNKIWIAGCERDGKIYKSTDDGETWTEKKEIGSSKTVFDLAFDPVNELFVAGVGFTSGLAGSVYISDDEGETWSETTDFGGSPLGIDAVLSVIVTSTGRILAGTGDDFGEGTMWKSDDNGASFDLIEDINFAGQDQSAIYSLAIDTVNDKIYLGTGTNGQIGVSADDGDTWVLEYDTPENSVHSLAYDSVYKVMIAGTFASAKVYTTGHPTVWENGNLITGGNFSEICWSSKLRLFCAVALGGTNNRVKTSPDGITWTIRTIGYDDNQWRSVCWSLELDLFCAVSSDGVTERVMTSPDGITWTMQTSILSSWQGICWSSGLSLFCAVGSNVAMTSPDGINWTNQAGAISSGWNEICWSPKLEIFCAVASSGTDRVMTSPDGINWTSYTITANQWNGVCWSPELSLFVAVSRDGVDNRVITSPDGINWTIGSTAGISSQWWLSVKWSSALGIFVAFGDFKNTVMTSPDGFFWRTQTLSSTQNWKAISWSPELELFAGLSDSGNGNIMLGSRLDADVPIQDLLQYTELDSASDIVVTSPKAAFSTMRGDANSHVYYDFGVDGLSDYNIEFEFQIDSADINSYALVCAVTDTLGPPTAGVGQAIYMTSTTGSDNRMNVQSFTVSASGGNIIGGAQVVRYARFTRNGNILKVGVFSDPERTQQILVTFGVEIGCVSTPLRYLTVLQSRNGTPADAETSGFVQNYRILSH